MICELLREVRILTIHTIYSLTRARSAVLTEVIDFSSLVWQSRTPQEHLDSQLAFLGNTDLTVLDTPRLPHSVMLVPVKSKVRLGVPTSGELVGVLGAVLSPSRFMVNALPDGVNGVTAVLENSCGQAFTYQINGNTVRNVEGIARFRGQFGGSSLMTRSLMTRFCVPCLTAYVHRTR
jgi:hypothetical protein